MNKKCSLRLLIALILWLTFAFQVKLGIMEYLRAETVQVSTTEDRNDFVFPSFTACPIIDKSGGIDKNFTEAYKDLKDGHNVLYAVRQFFKDNPGFMEYDFLKNVTGPNEMHQYTTSKPVTFTQLSTCITYDSPFSSEAGRDNALLFLFNMTGLSRVKITVHNRGMYLTSSNNFHGSFSFQHAPPEVIPQSNDNDYMNISIHGYILETSFKQSLTSQSCLSDYDKRVEDGTILGLEDCCMSYFAKKMDCDMPWTDETQRIYSKVCETKEEYQQLIDLYDTIDGYSASQLHNVSKCYPPCGIQSHLAVNYANHETTIPKPDNHSVILGIVAYYKTSTYTLTRQVLHYGFKDLVADFGGYLGLLLGFSFLDLYDVLAGFWSKIQVIFENTRKKGTVMEKVKT